MEHFSKLSTFKATDRIVYEKIKVRPELKKLKFEIKKSGGIRMVRRVFNRA